MLILTCWKNAQLFRLSICNQLYHHVEPQSVDLSCKSNKLFLYERNIGLKWDMIQFSWVKTFNQKKGSTLPGFSNHHHIEWRSLFRIMPNVYDGWSSFEKIGKGKTRLRITFFLFIQEIKVHSGVVAGTMIMMMARQ